MADRARGQPRELPASMDGPDHRWDEMGHYRVRRFTSRDNLLIHGGGALWQTPEGVMWIGSSEGVLEFDGEQWSVIPAPGLDIIESIVADDTGAIWVGGTKEIGVLRPDDAGRRRFVSVHPGPPGDDRRYSGLRQLVRAGPAVLASMGEAVIRWQDGGVNVWHPQNGGLMQVFAVGGTPWMVETDVGLHRLAGDRWELVSDDAFFREESIEQIFPEPDGSWLMVTSRNGIFRRREDRIERMPTEADELMASVGIRSVARLRDGGFVCGLNSRGAVLLDAMGRCEALVDQAYGASSEPIDGVFEDRDGNIWLSALTSICVVLRGSATWFDETRGYPVTLINGVEFRGGRTYFATGSGLFVLEPASPLQGGARLKLIGDDAKPVGRTAQDAEGILFGRDGGLFRLTDAGGIEKLLEISSTPQVVRPMKSRDDTILIGTREGLGVVWRDGGEWTWLGLLPEVKDSVWEIHETDGGEIWITGRSSAPYRVRFDAGQPPVPERAHVLRLDGADSIQNVDSLICTLHDGHVLFGGNGFGLYEYDEAAGRFRPYPDLTGESVGGSIEQIYFTDGRGDIWARLSGGDGTDRAWRILGRGRRAVDGSVSWEPVKPRIFGELWAFPVQTENPEDPRIVWTEEDEGIVRIDLAMAKPARTSPQPIMRDVQADGATLAEGTRLDFAERTISFRYAAPYFDSERRFHYEIRLEGMDRDWRAPVLASSREIGNPGAGSYRFLVRTVDALGRRSEATSFAFSIAPPWQRSPAAIAGYMLAGVLGVVVIVRWRVAALRRRNLELEEVVRDRTRELLVARDEADRANRAKSTFLANMSHELRTPLNGILGYTQILRRSPTVRDEDRRRVEVLQNSGEHLLRLVNEVLDLSKIEAGRLELRMGPGDVRSLVAGVAETFRPRAEEKGVELRIEIDPAAPHHVSVDEQKLGQVLLNLTGNAVKFTSAGWIALRIVRVGPDELLRFEVEDSGAGMAPDQLEAIFEPFHQVAQAGVITREGTGLGLTICSRIVTLMGGELRVESQPGRGSRFWFEVRLPEAASLDLHDGHVAQIVGYEGPQRRILVVDDVPANRDIVREMLEPLGFVVDGAADGGAALEQVAARRPDLVLTDLRMAPMDGAELVARLRADPANAGLKVVAFSASALQFSANDAKKMGCDGHLPKPFREADLFAVLAQLLDVKWLCTAMALEPGDEASSPPAELVRQLLGFARRGDAGALRAALKNARADTPEIGTFLDEIEALADAYRMQEIRDRLGRIATG